MDGATDRAASAPPLSGVRGPRAASGVARELPTPPTVVSREVAAAARAALAARATTGDRGFDSDSPSDISDGDRDLPQNMREMRIRFAERRRAEGGRARTGAPEAAPEADVRSSSPTGPLVPDRGAPMRPAAESIGEVADGGGIGGEEAGQDAPTDNARARLVPAPPVTGMATALSAAAIDGPALPLAPELGEVVPLSDTGRPMGALSTPPPLPPPPALPQLGRSTMRASPPLGATLTSPIAAPAPALSAAMPTPALLTAQAALAEPPTDVRSCRTSAADAVSAADADVRGDTEEPLRSPPGAFPTAADAATVGRRRQSGARRSATHRASGSRRPGRGVDATNTLLAALSSQGPPGPGNLLPSLYGYFSDEPAPTSLRPAGVTYGANGNGRVGQRNWRAPASIETSQVSASGDTMGRSHPGLAERILSSGPSITNLHPVSTNLLMSPGADVRATAARLRNSHILAGSVAFPAGALSEVGVVPARARDAHVSRKFEENSVVSISWTIENARQLRDELNDGTVRKHEAWNMKPLFGGERWRLELDRQVVTPLDEDISSPLLPFVAAPQPAETRSVLAVYLTYLELAGLAFSAQLPTQVMIGVRTPQRLHRMPRTLDTDFLWREFVPFSFGQNHDTLVLEQCPYLDDILGDPQVAEADAFQIVVQVATGPSVLPETDATGANPAVGMQLPFQAPDTVNVPHSLLQSLDGLVDDANTGDLMITVKEKGLQQKPSDELAESVGLKTFVQPWPTGTPLPPSSTLPGDEPVAFVRDRALWAHSAVLRSRSEFFGTMLDSSFSEGLATEAAGGGAGGRRDARRPCRMLRIPDADYVTMYWLLRYLYTEEVHLLKDEDIEAVTLDDYWILGQDSSATKPDWKWRRVPAFDDGDDGESPHYASPGGDMSFTRASQARTPLMLNAPTDPRLSDVQAPRVDARAEDGRTPGAGELRTRSESSTRLNSGPALDPHPHPPMLPVPPASALSLYRVAHRYHIPPLCELTTAHIVAQLTPQNATNYLLCTSLFDQLQTAIQNFIFQNWHAVASSPEFEHCCDQVSAGEWGPTAGRALASLMRNMRNAGGAGR
ncbi:hypothetical protein MSPP1_002875 [Malassezia sp. CBS 17886]|nr:hypothetical protein MSPP1_002875 [Malassezia sp. CBS 17886]